MELLGARQKAVRFADSRGRVWPLENIQDSGDELQYGSNDPIYVVKDVDDQTENKEQRETGKGKEEEKKLPVMTVCCEAPVLRRWLVDIGLCIPVSTVLLLCFLGVIPPKLPGIYCEDPDLSFEFKGDTISTPLLIAVSLIFPYFVLSLVEFCHLPSGRLPLRSKVLRCMHRGFRWYRDYMLGALFTFTLVDIMKTVMPEPRPHYFYSCIPNGTEGWPCKPGTFVYDYTCTGRGRFGWWHDLDVRKSFPSGHAALSTFVCVFMCWYLCQRVVSNKTSLLCTFLQFLCAIWAIVCSLTRITDHRHHWWDVLAGIICGIIGAVYTVRYLCNGFRRRVTVEQKPLENGGSLSPCQNNHHTSLKRLISSTSSYSTATLPENKELSEV